MAKPAEKPLTSQDMLNLLEKRYPKTQGFVFLTEVGDATGSAVNRHADAVVLQTWPSRGIALEGFEIKVSRSDLVRELENPRKADGVGRYCSSWWLVLSKATIMDGLVIPATWGILVAGKRDRLDVVRQPKIVKKPKEWTPTFIAALVRNASEGNGVEAARREAREEGFRDGQKYSEGRRASTLERLEHLEKKVQAFDAGLGRGFGLEHSSPDRARELGTYAKAWLGMSGEKIEAIKRLAYEVGIVSEDLNKTIADFEASPQGAAGPPGVPAG